MFSKLIYFYVTGEKLPQVVFPEGSGQQGCSVTITMDNWQQQHSIEVQGSLDSVIDGTQSVDITLGIRADNRAILTINKEIKVTEKLK